MVSCWRQLFAHFRLPPLHLWRCEADLRQLRRVPCCTTCFQWWAWSSPLRIFMCDWQWLHYFHMYHGQNFFHAVLYDYFCAALHHFRLFLLNRKYRDDQCRNLVTNLFSSLVFLIYQCNSNTFYFILFISLSPYFQVIILLILLAVRKYIRLVC